MESSLYFWLRKRFYTGGSEARWKRGENYVPQNQSHLAETFSYKWNLFSFTKTHTKTTKKLKKKDKELAKILNEIDF